MKPEKRLKKTLLKGLVEQNVELLEGQPSSRGHRGKRSVRWAARLALIAVPLVMLSTALFVTMGWAPGVRQALRVVEPPAFFSELGDDSLDLTGVSAPEIKIRFTGPPADLDRRVFQLPVQRIVIDPGHGGRASGTQGFGLLEKDLTLDISKRLRDLLDDRYEVAMTREEDVDLSLTDRVAMANEARADLFLSVHINWISQPSVRGIETYYLGFTEDPEREALARRENAEDSGYSLADLGKVLQGMLVEARQDESRYLASELQTAMFRSLKKSNPALRDRGVKTAPFVVLVGTEMPAILAEVSCLSNPDEAELLRKESYRQSIAQALYDGVVAYARSLRDSDEPAIAQVPA